MTFRHLAPLTLLAFAGAVAAGDAPQKDKDKAPAASTTAAPIRTTTANAPNAGAERGRDWSRIDTNRDHAISPEEMEKYLAENPGPLKK